jgi:hypothetical protein
LSISKKEHPALLPQADGSAKELLTEIYHPVEFNKAKVNLLTKEFFLLEAIIYSFPTTFLYQ